MKDEGSSGGGRARLAVVADGEVADEDDKVHCVCGCSEKRAGQDEGGRGEGGEGRAERRGTAEDGCVRITCSLFQDKDRSGCA